EVTVRKRLEEAHGRTILRNLFEDRWPQQDENVETVGNMTAATARDGDFLGVIARFAGLSEGTVRRRLDDAHGKTLVRNIFEKVWSVDEVEQVRDVDTRAEKRASVARGRTRNEDRDSQNTATESRDTPRIRSSTRPRIIVGS